MLTGLSKIFRRSNDRDIDGEKPRDAYLDVLKEIQSAKPTRARLKNRAVRMIFALKWGRRDR
jgi:hypothetical protein